METISQSLQNNEISSTPMSSLSVQDWGFVEYTEALKRQEDLVEQVYKEQSAGVIVFCKHPPVVTTGRKTQAGDVFSWQGNVVEVSRGGRATYHGPNQLVIYPILNLAIGGRQRPVKDLNWYLRHFENVLVESLADIGIPAMGKTAKTEANTTSSDKEETGVWTKEATGSRKIASLGIAVRHWISYHGAAINLHHDPNAFQGLMPCGFSPNIMVSCEELLKRKIDEATFQKNLLEKLLHCLA